VAKKHTFNQRELRNSAYSNAAALIESMDFEQLYADFGLKELDTEDDCGQRMEDMQNEVAAYLRRRIRV
jgi:hypothetical protein